MRHVLPLILTALLLSNCSAPPTEDRAGKLLNMAAEEAGQISSTLDRFSRQLNIADTQLRTNRNADAAKSLALARDTLTSAQGAATDTSFDAFHRIAGWTAISQLARAAGDRDLALKASDNALAALNNVTPVQDRALYVLSLAGELAELKGKDSAIELLNSGATWAAEIPNAPTRRQALTAFAYRLLAYDAFDTARNTLRKDPDPAWRTDTFLALANYYSQIGNYNQVGAFDRTASAATGLNLARGGGGAGGSFAMGESAQAERNRPASPSLDYGKDVRFESVYKHQ